MRSDLEPRVYVACLACYNNGTLHGEWFDADETLSDETAKYFGRNDEGFLACGGEETLVHDFEGFGGYKLGEVSECEAAEIGAAFREHGVPLVLALANDPSGGIERAIKTVEECYRGEHDSLADFAEEFHRECGDLPEGPLAQYIDWERYARELEMSGDVWSAEHDGKTHVFWSH